MARTDTPERAEKVDDKAEERTSTPEIVVPEIVVPENVKFFNLHNPGTTFLVEHDTSPEAKLNPMTAAETYAMFVNGELATADPKIIAWCRSAQGRAKGCREYSLAEDMLEIRDTPELLEKYIQQLADIRAREIIAEQKHTESLSGR